MRRTQAPLFARQPPLNGRRASSSCLAVAGRLGARSPLTVPAPAGAALAPRRSRSNFLPTSRSAPREPAPESSLLGRSRPRASARRPSRRSMCGRACTPCTRAAARSEVGWLPGQLGRLNSSRTRRLPSELKVQIGTSLVAGARRHGGAVGHRRELSDPGIRARLAGAALQSERANSHILRGDTRENRNRASK